MRKEVKVATNLNESSVVREAQSCRHRARVLNAESGPCQRCERRGRGGGRFRALMEKMRRQKFGLGKLGEGVVMESEAKKSHILTLRTSKILNFPRRFPRAA